MGRNQEKARTLKLRFLSPACIELDDAIRFYDHQMPGLGFRSFQEVEAAIERNVISESRRYNP